MNDSNKILNGIKTNDEETWKTLYEEFMPVAKSFFNNRPGDIENAKDLLQNTFIKVLLKCRKGYYHENIKAVIAKRLKWDWLDMIRSSKNIMTLQADENTVGESMYFADSNKPFSSNVGLNKIFGLSGNYLSRLKKTHRVEEFLDYDKLNEPQKKIIEIFLNKKKTSERCKKLLLLTEFLPISDNEFIAREMGYIADETKEGIKRGKDILKSRKALCLSRLRQSFNNFKTHTK